MLSPDMRKRHVLTYEGQGALQHRHARPRDCDRGIMKALIRVEGSEAAARYAFALADRVVGGVREPPALPMIAPPPPVELPKPKSAEPKRVNLWTIFIMGWCSGSSQG